MTQTDETKLIVAANAQIISLQKAVRWTKFQLRVVAGVCVALLIGAVVSGFLYANQLELSQKLQSGAIQGCEQANVQRTTDKENWDYFLTILLKGDTNKKDIALGKQIEAHVAQGDKTRDCETSYGK